MSSAPFMIGTMLLKFKFGPRAENGLPFPTPPSKQWRCKWWELWAQIYVLNIRWNWGGKGKCGVCMLCWLFVLQAVSGHLQCNQGKPSQGHLAVTNFSLTWFHSDGSGGSLNPLGENCSSCRFTETAVHICEKKSSSGKSRFAASMLTCWTPSPTFSPTSAL